MKHLTAAAPLPFLIGLVGLVGLVGSPLREAAACTIPEQTCSEIICRPADAVIEARVASVKLEPNWEVREVTLYIRNAYGDAPELVVDTYVTVGAAYYLFDKSSVNETYVLYAERTPTGELQVTDMLLSHHADQCFGDGTSTEAIASTILSDDCYEQLESDAASIPVTACYGPFFGCSASGAGTASSALIVFGLAVLGRTRRRPRA